MKADTILETIGGKPSPHPIQGIGAGFAPKSATLAAIAQKPPEIEAGDSVLGFNYDTGERYLSIEGFLPAE